MRIALLPLTLLLLTLLLPLAAPLAAQRVDVYSRPVQTERTEPIDVQHYTIRLALNPATKTVDGHTTIRFRATDGNLQQVTFDAATFAVEAVTDTLGHALPFTHADDQLRIDLPAPLATGTTYAVHVRHHADRPTDPTAYGVSAGYALGISFKDATATNPALVNTLSWPEGARHWFPGIDHPKDRATHDTIVTVPEAWQVLSNGERVADRVEDGLRTVHWSMPHAHPTYLYAVVAGPYVVVQDQLGDLPVSYWVYPDEVQHARRSFGRTPEIMRFLEVEYGVPFPWVKNDQITIPGIGGGAESTTATVIGESTLHDARADLDYPSHWLVAHEAAHQWWGDFISYRDWTHAWIAESFATYSEYRWAWHDLGPDEGALNMDRKRQAYLREARDRYERPIVFDRWRYPSDMFDRHLYEKGATVLHMFRDLLGDATFDAIIRRFLTDHAYQPAATEDFLATVRAVTGREYRWFFDQWLFRPGHPVLEVADTWDEASGQVRVRVQQVQDTTTGTPIYRLPVRLDLVTDGLRHSEHVWTHTADTTFVLASPARPDFVRFDAADALLKEWTYTKPVDDLLAQVIQDDATGRRWAAAQLATHRTNDGVGDVLRSVSEHDPFWAVREAALRARAPDDAVFVQRMARRDPHSRVRAEALRQLGEQCTSPNADHAAFLRLRYEHDHSYVAQAAALRALGRCGSPADRPLLEAAAQVRSPRNVLASAARAALERLSP